MKLTEIELFRDDMKFSAAHFTIFSSIEREMLHGHNFHVYIKLGASVDENGLAFDYTSCRDKILELCCALNGRCLMPSKSKYLTFIATEENYEFIFNNQKIILPKNDVLLMPLENISTELLSDWFLEKMDHYFKTFDIKNIEKMTVKISTGSGQFSSSVKTYC